MTSYCTELRAGNEGDELKLEGLAVVFNRSTVLYESNGIQYKEIISPTALDATDMKDVVLRYNHEGSFIILARTRNGSLMLEKRSEGLYMVATLQSDIRTHREVYAAIKSGLVDKMSFAFSTAEGGDRYDEYTRTITNIRKLFDVSIVDQPAYAETWVEARSKFEAAGQTNETAELLRQVMDTQINILKRRMCI